MPKGSVKIMLSYNYCHFEVALASDEEMTLEQIDNLRKDAQRLADKAVRQYQVAKERAEELIIAQGNIASLKQKVKVIKENFPQSEWTPDQKAMVKKLEDYEYIINHPVYDYEDDEDDDY
jgi:hypothetical protein